MRLVICAVLNVAYSFLILSGALAEFAGGEVRLSLAGLLSVWLIMESLLTIKRQKAQIKLQVPSKDGEADEISKYEKRIAGLEDERMRLRDHLTQSQLKEQSLSGEVVKLRSLVKSEPESGIRQRTLINFLSLLQEQGRFIDFFLDDIAPYGNEQIGAAARVVHQGCGTVLKSRIVMSPVYTGQEGDEVSLEGNFDSGKWRIVGRMNAAGPFRGKVLHRGWKVEKFDLPGMRGDAESGAASVIMPAELEVE